MAHNFYVKLYVTVHILNENWVNFLFNLLFILIHRLLTTSTNLKTTLFYYID